MKKINISKKKIIILSIIVIVVLTTIIVCILNSSSFKMKQYLKQNYTNHAEFKNSGYILVKKDDKFGIIDYNKNILFECIYEQVDFIEYKDTYLILLKSNKEYILLDSKLNEIIKSENEILVYNDEGYIQIWEKNQFTLMSLNDNRIFASGKIDLDKNTIEYLFENSYKLIHKINGQANIEENIGTYTLWDQDGKIIYENIELQLFNDKYLLYTNQQGYKLIDFNGKDVTISYINQIKCKNSEIYLVDENSNNLVRLKITKNENSYDVVKEKVK